jgi:glycosyltransferase involved in cell wall biosynthesis
MTPRMSIVIPAHDEGPLVRESIERMLHGAEPGEFEVVVVANGCSDDTAQQARAVPGVTVVEIAQGSKIAALNAGDERARVLPRAYIDADVALSVSALRGMAETLAATPSPRAVAPRLVVDASRSSLPVRCHARIWAASAYRARGHVGSGVYAVNAAGRERWGEFPDVIADDRFVQLRFSPEERTTLTDETFTVHAPRTMRALVRRGVRIELGNRQLPHNGTEQNRGGLLGRVARSPRLWPSFPFYVWGYILPKVVARRRPTGPVAWDRDSSLREAARR